MCEEKTLISIPTDSYVSTDDGMVELMSLPILLLPNDPDAN